MSQAYATNLNMAGLYGLGGANIPSPNYMHNIQKPLPENDRVKCPTAVYVDQQ